MPKELNAEVSLVKMRLSRRNLSLDQARLLLAVAQTSVPDEIKAKFLRDQGISTVQASVHVDAAGQASLSFHGVVRVKLTYKGDMVRSSPMMRERINHRLAELAQKHCMEAVFKELAEQKKGRPPT